MADSYGPVSEVRKNVLLQIGKLPEAIHGDQAGSTSKYFAVRNLSDELSERKVDNELGWRVLCHDLGVVLVICALWWQSTSVATLVTAVAQ